MPKIQKGYKQTEIGVIPEDWEVKKIIDFTDCTAGGTPSTFISSYWGGNIKWMNSGELNDKKIFDVIGRITEDGLKNSSTKIIPQDCVLVGLAGQGKTRGTVAINRVSLCINQSIAGIFPSTEHDSDYLYYNLDSRYDELRSLSTGGEGRGGLNLSILRNFLIALPKSKPEQKAIAEVLSDTDALIERLGQLIEKKRWIKQGAMQRLLTGKQRLPGFTKKWGVNSIEELERNGLLRLFRGKVISKHDIENVPGSYPIYSSSVQDNGVFGHYGEYMFDEELITWSIDGGGHFFYRPKHKFSVTNVCGYMRVNAEKVFSRFLAAQLQLLHSRLLFDYTLKAHPSVIRKAYVVSLPSFEEQSAISSILSDMDTEIEALERQRAKYRNIKQGMMQSLLTGRIRLPLS